MGAFINLKASDGAEISAWRADPAGKPRGGVVVIQEIFGVNAVMRAVCDTLARTVVERELSTGAVTAVLGGPFFVMLLVGQKRRAALWGP